MPAEGGPVELAALSWGDGPRRLLLLHGLSSNAAGWWRLGPDLAGLGFRVTAPDLRGHGASPPGSDYRLASYAGDLYLLGDGWEVVVGHSLGGAVAAVAAAARPGWTARLVLADPALVLPDRDAAVGWLLSSYEGEISAAAVAAEQPRWHPEDCRIKAEAMRDCPPSVVEETVDDNLPWDLRSGLADLDVPTLLLGADPAEGAVVPAALGEAVADANPRVDYRVVAGAGHSLHRDSYPATLEALRGWL